MSGRRQCCRCGDLGWYDDPCDSGSGWTVYCDCPAGRELKDAEYGELEDGHGNPLDDASLVLRGPLERARRGLDAAPNR